MFDPAEMVPFSDIPLSVLESDAHKALSLKMARESMVLLKNENNLLPLKKNLKKIAIIGPNADNPTAVLGNYNGFPTEIVTPLTGIKRKLNKKTQVIYEKAIDYVAQPNNDSIADIVNRMKGVDVVIMCGGISPELEGEEMPVNIEGFTRGDRTTIALPRVQTALLKALHSANIPVVFVNMSGSAIGMEWESANLPAILTAWYGGQDAGTAIADVLFGDYNPSGRLPVTFYKNDKDLPAFNNYDMEKRTYRYFNGEVSYPFGYGLSYANFEYSSLQMPDVVNNGQSLKVTVDVTNKSKINGDEVVQLYITHKNAGYRTALYTLKAFKRIHLKAGETQTVTLELNPEQLNVIDEYGNTVFQPGKAVISVGGTSPGATTAKRLPVVNKEIGLK
ncbi:glycoside hydrolase family 3 C-terminal domain-containing protein [Bacteroides sp. 519]|uniref:glycoside hydrolase family 3 C-terminal domain-containing protein n=1 Tax=Bacteroides sp. 519 TaxID=2302937 RepID=UPI001EF1B30A|nr:glycoside hydrolase family 3 C-terminal domain-containing protein [Bacteroides sp. 519]